MRKNILILMISFLVLVLSAHAINIESDPAGDSDTLSVQDYKRFALVIGNKDYEYRPLENPVKDAQAIKDFLIKRGFAQENIFYAENADLVTMRSKRKAFLAQLSAEKKSIAFVYYSGHGTQEISRDTDRLTNYLIPINNKRIDSITSLDMYSLSLNQLLGEMNEFNHGLNIVLMDACRDGLPAFSKSARSASLAPMSAKGVFVAYATDSGTSAADNSYFRKSFIEQASQPKTLTAIFTAVKQALYDTSQLPVFMDRTTGGAFYFTGSKDDDPEVLKSNYYLTRIYENKVIVAINKGNRKKSLIEYRKAFLYALEAKKLKIQQKYIALEQSTLDQLTDLSIDVLSQVNLGFSINNVTDNPNDKMLFSMAEDGTIIPWDETSSKLKQTLQGHKDSIHALSYSPNGRVFASGGKDQIKLWDVRSREIKQVFKGHESNVYALSYSPDGRTLASAASGDQTIKLWDVALGKMKQTFKNESYITALSYSPDGKTLASASYDYTIELWDIVSGKLKQKLKGHEGGVYALSYSPDGNVLASASDDNTIKLWNSSSGILKQTLKGHTDNINALSYSPNGKTLSSASDDKTIRLWDVKSGEMKQILKGHKGRVFALCYNADGSILASGSEDTHIKLWNVISGELKQTLRGHEESIFALSYSPDNSTLISGSEDTTIKFWTKSMLNTQDLFYKYEPNVVSNALQFLWEMGLDDDKLTIIHKPSILSLYDEHDNLYAGIQYPPLLAYSLKGKTKADQLIQWLEDNKAYKKQ